MEDAESLSKDLSDTSKDVLQKFFGWAKRKRVSHIKDVDGEYVEYKSASLTDESFNRADVSDILQGFITILKVTIEKESKDHTMSVAELLRQVLQQVDSAGVKLSVDLSRLESPDALSRMGQLEKLSLERPLGAPASLLAKPKPAALAPLSAPAPVAAPVGPSENELKLEEDNRRLHEKLAKVQQQYTTMMQEKSKLAQELHTFQESSTTTTSASLGKIKQLEDTIAELKAALEKKESEVVVGQKELTGKLSESQQFKTLKKLLAQKNQQVKELRNKLQKYEPDSTPTEVKEESSDED